MKQSIKLKWAMPAAGMAYGLLPLFKPRLLTVMVAALMILAASLLFCQPVLAISESEVQARVAAAGKEAVAGNVLIWFLCAVAFLKVSQKIDSFMGSLGINVGHTGGSMIAEAVIAARGIGAAKDFAGGRPRGGFGGKAGTSNVPGSGGTGGGFLSGGLAGVASRGMAENARKNATAPAGGPSGGGKSGMGLQGQPVQGLNVGGRMYASSVGKGGDFANSIISSIATGRIGPAGAMTGAKAVEALNSYTGNTALGPGAANVPQFSDVEIGGGRITGTETSEDHPGGAAFGMYHTAQYAPPEGDYSTVQTKDGASWYKQYAADRVDRSPYMAPDGSVAYKEAIVKKLPPPPARKDRP